LTILLGKEVGVVARTGESGIGPTHMRSDVSTRRAPDGLPATCGGTLGIVAHRRDDSPRRVTGVTGVYIGRGRVALDLQPRTAGAGGGGMRPVLVFNAILEKVVRRTPAVAAEVAAPARADTVKIAHVVTGL